MIKKEIYPKTKRIGLKGIVTITEKVDGSNLCIFKTDGKLFVAQRTTIYEAGELESSMMYKGLFGWLEKHKINLLENLNENSVLCGEWVGMGKLKYSFDQNFLMFAKANITEEFELTNLNYNINHFIYPFINQEIPSYIGIVPTVYQGSNLEFLSKETLDTLYTKYIEKVGRSVEGFVVNYENNIVKYVRMKNGKLSDHHESGQGE